MKKDIVIITDCICDLPYELVERYNVYVIYHYIFTDTGRFRDLDEISSKNVFDYMATGRVPYADNPPVEEYVEIFRKNLKYADEIIYFAMTSRMATTYSCSMEAKKALGEEGERVHILDTKLLSAGMGHLVLNACNLLEQGMSAEEIVRQSESIIDKISCSFIVRNVDYLHKNGLVRKGLRNFCNLFNIHPVLCMKDGYMSVKRFYIGNYEKAQVKYIKSELKKNSHIRKERVFVPHADCTAKELSSVLNEVERYCNFSEILLTRASATVSCFCGPHSVGVMYLTY